MVGSCIFAGPAGGPYGKRINDSGSTAVVMTLEALRDEIASIDCRIIDLIAERQELAARMAEFKHHEELPVTDPHQREAVLSRAFDYAVEKNIDPVETRKIFALLITMSEERQHEYLGEGNLP